MIGVSGELQVPVRCGGKAALAALALALPVWLGFSFWPVLIFFGIASSIYFSESPERRTLRTSFWLSSLLAVLGTEAVSRLSEPFWTIFFSVFIALIFGIAVFVILGLMNALFKNRVTLNIFLNACLSACFFILILSMTPDFGGESFLPPALWFVALFSGTALLTREILILNAPIRGRRTNMAVWSLAILIAEVAAFTVFLPVGFVNGAALLVLCYILGRDLLLARLRGDLLPSLVFRGLTVFTVILTLIFATVTWILP